MSPQLDWSERDQRIATLREDRQRMIEAAAALDWPKVPPWQQEQIANRIGQIEAMLVREVRGGL